MGSSIPKKEPGIAQDRGTSENGEYNPLAILTIHGITGKDARELIFKNLKNSSAKLKDASMPIEANAADRVIAMAQSRSRITEIVDDGIEGAGRG